METTKIEGACHCGSVHWSFAGTPESATACNCTICRRYGTLWAYDFENERITVTGPTKVYEWQSKWLGFHFCPQCACVAYWRQTKPGNDGRRRMGVNCRLADPAIVAALPLHRHDGLGNHDDLPRDGRTVADMWF